MVKKNVSVCDICSKTRIAIDKCSICGKDICDECRFVIKIRFEGRNNSYFGADNVTNTVTIGVFRSDWTINDKSEIVICFKCALNYIEIIKRITNNDEQNFTYALKELFDKLTEVSEVEVI